MCVYDEALYKSTFTFTFTFTEHISRALDRHSTLVNPVKLSTSLGNPPRRIAVINACQYQ